MKRLVTAIVMVAALTLTGCGAAAEVAVTKPTAVVVDKELQEDDPGWNCLLHGNKICGASEADRAEAWTRIEPGVIPDNAEPFKIEYRGKGLVGIYFDPAHYYTVNSSTGGYVHVFEIERGVTS